LIYSFKHSDKRIAKHRKVQAIYTAVFKQYAAVVLGAGETSSGNLWAVESGARLAGWERNIGWALGRMLRWVSLHTSLLL
jgi:hypothetical protein